MTDPGWPNIDLVRQKVVSDMLRQGRTHKYATEYADAIVTYLALAHTKFVERCNTLATWETKGGKMRGTFARQAISMVWDFAEVNPFGPAGFMRCVETTASALEKLPVGPIPGVVRNEDAAKGWPKQQGKRQ